MKKFRIPRKQKKRLKNLIALTESWEDLHKILVNDGQILQNGKPKRCECGCSDFKRVDIQHEEGYVCEYSMKCINERCEKIVGCWSYGYWEL